MFNLNILKNNLCYCSLNFLDNTIKLKEGLIGKVGLKKKGRKVQTEKKKKELGSTGIVISVSDELVVCSGLSKAKYGELVKIKKNKKTYFGLVLNIS